MKITRKDALVAIITNSVLLLGIHTTEAGQDPPPLSSAQIIQILSSPDRTTVDRTNDLRRKPEQMLSFIGIHLSSRSISVPPVVTRRSCWPVPSDLPVRSMARAGRAIPTRRRPTPPRQRATATQILRRVRLQRRRHRPRRAHLLSHWPIARLGSARPAFRRPRSSPSPGPSRTPFLRIWRNRLIW